MVYGLGSESKAYYERPTSARESARATYTPSVLSQMEARLKKTDDEFHIATISLKKSEEEVHATREQLKATKEELSARILLQKYICWSTMISILYDIYTLCLTVQWVYFICNVIFASNEICISTIFAFMVDMK